MGYVPYGREKSFVRLGAVPPGLETVFYTRKGGPCLAKRVTADAAEFLPQFDEDLLLNLRTTVDKFTCCVGRHRTLARSKRRK